MKNMRKLSIVLLVILMGVFFQYEILAQEQDTKIQQDNLKFYQQREINVPQGIKVNLQNMRDLTKEKNYLFMVSYTTAMQYPIEQITGLVEPEDLNEQIKAQNAKAEMMMQNLNAPMKLGTCVATASNFDWRQNNGTTPVRDQSNCGSCWDFATCGAYEGNYRLINGRSRDVSEQQVLDCNPWGYSCGGGWWAFQYFIDKGVTTEVNYPYTHIKGTCKTPVTVPYKATTWGYVSSSSGVPSTTLIKQALCEHGPLAVAVFVTPLFRAYSSGVFNENINTWSASKNVTNYESVRASNNIVYYCTHSGTTGNTQPIWPLPTDANPKPSVNDGTVTWKYWGGGSINHGVTLIGWDDSKSAWLIKNSWGTGWGDVCGFGTERGYMWISYATNNIGFAAAWVQVVSCTGCDCP